MFNDSKTISLKVFQKFKASHSLVGFEQPHFHLWKIAVQFQSAFPLVGDRLIDLVFLQAQLGSIIAPLEGSYLNHSLGISPTSENMAAFIWKKAEHAFGEHPLHSVSVTICTLEGEPMGEAVLS